MVRPSQERLLFVQGCNFSGRTDLLRTLIRREREVASNDSLVPGVYIGPEVYNALSGLSLNVFQELRLHSVGSPVDAMLPSLREKLGLPRLYERNPFSLSGGEQALVVLTSCLTLGPRLLAIDGALEQVDTGLRDAILDWIIHVQAGPTRVVVADNSLADWSSEGRYSEVRLEQQPKSSRLGSIRPIESSVVAPSRTGLLHFEGLQFSYCDRIPVIREASGTLEPGCIYFLDGPNGAGKSTLAKLLCGVLKPDAGLVHAPGAVRSIWHEPGRRIGYHFQNPDVQLFKTTVREEIMSGLSALGYAPSEARDRCAWAIDAFGLCRVEIEHPLDLPFVARKRLALACLLATGLPWIILDEPSLGQDTSSVDAIRQIVEQLCKHGTGIIIISHAPCFRRDLEARTLCLDCGVLKPRLRVGVF